MMYEYLIFGVAFGGTMIAAILDLWTTEVPDSISIIVGSVSFGLHLALSWVTGDITYALWSAGLGVGFLAAGWALYCVGGWGGADAVVLGSLGFALPYIGEVMAPLGAVPWPYPFTFMLNILIIGSLYSLAYAMYKGFTVDGLMQTFLDDIRNYAGRMMLIMIAVTGVMAGIALAADLQGLAPIGSSLQVMVWYLPLLIGLLILYRYLRIVEDHGLVREIDVEDLAVGDVVVEEIELEAGDIHPSRIVGIDEDQLDELIETKETVEIQHGVRFVLTFPLAFAATAFLGDLVLLALDLLG